ncbi:hypothetical protein [Epilithonimonas xixisoli]|uniref:Uncharacterized protein n=1 Tax=Epilithonimonas xixisoli TaxID=1476462 RepID=A0A4R8I9L7_9FLAO|nr:hypothetical protein [Epilithonimonas xixisoli]TDX86200.1 hypothetical protein B0I22_0310 [Epilithonimonas xixisoli]
MQNFTINAQDYIIDDIISHLENGTIGQAIARSWNYERKNNTLYFTLKEGAEVRLADLFWFGFLSNG